MSYKMKTHSGAKKRFTKTASGKIKFIKAGKNHLLTKKTKKSKRDMRRNGYLCKSDENHIKNLI